MIVLKVVAFILASWLLVHLLAVFGVFLALAYPLWWILESKRFPCLWCRIKEAKKCTFSHSLLDAGLVLVFTLVSFGLVFGESKILFKMGFPPTPKTVSFVIPAKKQYRLGEIFPMDIEIVGIKKPINAIQTDLGFEPEKLEVQEISTQNSFANIFIQKEINNEVGYARLTGGLPNPGYFSDRGIFGTVYFKAKTPGIAKVDFLPSSLVLANDGWGTNVVKELASVSFLILPEKISQEEEEQQKQLLSSVVLGAEEGKPMEKQTQMKFYEETGVLGAQVGQEIEKEKKVNLAEVLLGILEKIDRFILSFWDKILQLSALLRSESRT